MLPAHRYQRCICNVFPPLCLPQINPAAETVSAADVVADLPPRDPNESSCQSRSTSVSKQQDGRPGSAQTQISTAATSCTLDDIDTDSPVPSVSERLYPKGCHSNPPVYVAGDTYSIVGSLNPHSRGAVVNGTGGAGLYAAGVPLLNMCTLQRKEPSSLPLPGGAAGDGGGRVEPTPTDAADLRSLRMKDLLDIRLDQVTFDLSQPPYDSLQTYEFEGRDSRAESLSSLESDGEKDDGRVVGGMEELNQKFQRLVEIISEREKEKVAGGEALDKITAQREDKVKQQQKWDF